MKQLDLGLTGKARIWKDENFNYPWNFRPIYPAVDERRETINNHAKSGSLSKKQVMLERLVPLGARFLYGCLGAIFEPNNSDKLVLNVVISTELEREVNFSLATSLDVVRVGIPEEYANSVFIGAKSKLQEPAISDIFGSGEVYFKWGTFGEIGSSRAFFHDLACAVIEVMVREKVRANYPITPPFKEFPFYRSLYATPLKLREYGALRYRQRTISKATR
ncbi:hypothetical protein [Cylindrospermum sp. FACHB-282]|uniref:hypothetical protein n=1 Tax=Cylindrospermum sp. FACHB-282 TaxID=2692794 RepID=UPI0016868A43|nr:hypothetical protein [Cylindrospermum sp. FACHB-282]MBD2385906.1 hypothetical protein [Cylindrospermum sp. FACHB-282]